MTVRERVDRDWRAARRAEALARYEADLLERHGFEVRWPAELDPGAAGEPGRAPGTPAPEAD